MLNIKKNILEVEIPEHKSFIEVYKKLDKNYKLKYIDTSNDNRKDIKISKFNTLKGIGFRNGVKYDLIAFNSERIDENKIKIQINSRDSCIDMLLRDTSCFKDVLKELDNTYTKIIFNGDDVTDEIVLNIIEDDGYCLDAL